MSIIIDIIIIAIIAVSAFFAYKKGFIGTLFSLLGTIVAIVLSIMLCTPVSAFINDNFVNPTVKSYIIKVVDTSSIGQSYEQALTNGADIVKKVKEMPASLKSVLDLAGIKTEDIIAEANKTEANAAQAVDNLINKIATPISTAISRVVALVGLFIILSIALWVVCKLITAVFNVLPLGKKLNKFGGLAFGIVRGLLIVLVLSTLFTAVSKGVDPKSNNIFSNKTIESTVVLKTVNDFNPINSILNIK